MEYLVKVEISDCLFQLCSHWIRLLKWTVKPTGQESIKGNVLVTCNLLRTRKIRPNRIWDFSLSVEFEPCGRREGAKATFYRMINQVLISPGRYIPYLNFQLWLITHLSSSVWENATSEEPKTVANRVSNWDFPETQLRKRYSNVTAGVIQTLHNSMIR